MADRPVSSAGGAWRDLLAGAWNDLRSALALLTVLPVGPRPTPLVLRPGAPLPAESRPGFAFAWFPLVGLLIGAMLAGVAALLETAPLLRGLAVLGLWVLLTGALHMDGWGDCCDALLATTSVERRLEILKDPRAGSFAVVGLGLLLLGKFVAAATLAQPLLAPALLVAPVAGRWAMTAAAWTFRSARPGGMGDRFRDGLGRPQRIVASVTAVAVVVTTMFWAPLVLVVLLVAPLVAFGAGKWAAGRLGGGLTGDVYGALCEGTELLCLLILALPIPL